MFIAFEMSCTTILSLHNAEKKKPVSSHATLKGVLYTEKQSLETDK